jgi:CARDB
MMYHPRIVRLVAIAAAMAPALWARTAAAQTIQRPNLTLPAPDLVVTKISVGCTNVAVTVKNNGGALLQSTPIVVSVRALMSLEGGGSSDLEKALVATSLSPGQIETVNFLIPGAPGLALVSATADFTKVVTESNETNNEQLAIDEQTCPILTVTNATVDEGGELVFTATINRRPENNASFAWTISPVTAVGGSACSGGVDFLTASGGIGFPATEAVPTPRTVKIKTCSDPINESAETVRLILSSVKNMHVRQRTMPLGTINNQGRMIAR